MKAEIIAVGTEMLLGEIVDTNSPFIAKKLAQCGIDLFYEVTVGDNEHRLTEAIQTAENRSDLIILIGGLGPTEDDITKQTLAKHLKVVLERDPAGFEKLNAHFEAVEKEMTANNEHQAMILAESQSIPNPNGLAVGDYVVVDQKHYILLPGPPWEFKPMVEKEVMPILETLSQRHFYSRTLHFYGIGESKLSSLIDPIIAEQTNPTIAIYIKPDDVTVRLTAEAANQLEADSLIDLIQTKILAKLNAYFYGVGDDLSLPAVVVNKLKQTGLSITAAESLTGGLFQSTLCSIPGASEIFQGGFVTYALETKASLLGIDADQLKRDGVVSAQTAQAMAEHAREKLDANIGVSFTGVAGPDPLEGRKVGTVYIGVAFGDQTQTALFHFAGTRADIRQRSVMSAFMMIYDKIK